MSSFEMPIFRNKETVRRPARVEALASEALHDRAVYTTMDGRPTATERERFVQSLRQDESAGEAIAGEQEWAAGQKEEGPDDAEKTADLERIVALSQEKFALIEKWKGRVDHKNPEYLEDMRKLATIISESVRLEMKSALGRDQLDS